jgi:hypothetical protein
MRFRAILDPAQERRRSEARIAQPIAWLIAQFIAWLSEQLNRATRLGSSI